MSFWDTPTKDIPRHVVMVKRPVNTKRPRAAATSLTLPGDKIMCVLRGHESGLFNQHTQHVFVERDPATQARIVRLAKQKLNCEWDPILWRTEITNCPLRAVLSNRPLEFAYLDFCAALNSQVARWIYTELAPALANGATLAVTLSRNWRASKYMKWWDKAIKSRHSVAGDEYRDIEDRIQSAPCSGVVGDIFDFYDDVNTSHSESYSTTPGSSKWSRLLRPEYHPASVKVISAFTVLLAYFNFELEACIEYQRSKQSSTHMTTFVLTNLQRRPVPRMSTVFLRELGQHMRPTMLPTY